MPSVTIAVSLADPAPARHRRHGRDCAGRCITRAYAFAGGLVAVLAALHVALHW